MNKDKIYDVAVIGAGIHGAGVAQAAAVRGWSVVVVEQFAGPAEGTSSKSSKLIHGGLRYLERFQFKLVCECLKERRKLCELAPGLVELKPFLIPIGPHMRRNRFVIFFGLLLYWVLSGFRPENFPRWVGAKKLHKWIPGLQASSLRGALLYSDAQTDDRKLTAAVLKSAESLGALSCYEHKVRAIAKLGDFYKIEFEGDHAALICRTLVNAAGPWVNLLADKISPKVPQIELEWVQGSHLVLNRPAPSHCIYCESPDDQRALFILPWQGKTLIGTTEKEFSDNPQTVQPSQEEIEYLLRTYNHYLPTQKASAKDILEQFAGLRVLPLGGDSMNARSRETLLITRSANPAYVAIYGGKLTAYRLTAAKVTEFLASTLLKSNGGNTEQLRLQ